jgi:hypothetical protein
LRCTMRIDYQGFSICLEEIQKIPSSTKWLFEVF